MRGKEKNSHSPGLGLRFRSSCSGPPLSQGFRNGFYHCTVSKMVLDKMSQWHCKDEICHLSSVISCVHFIWRSFCLFAVPFVLYSTRQVLLIAPAQIKSYLVGCIASSGRMNH
ncbi:uncharacterized protein LOC114272291 isoform X2 [Camellia sinensis]|uniref:uncharacterized protein LOC114272291 isoform X2 n=1 Tax=Camellia sinensis TaxID=4442 RepID=UPI0010366D7A|nr:uncharacterized protein LOC114272291 isoform X2 [Camellia sinensis]XP_028069760.1 uncharacterized protein LOC114272291 isoform X2 [Camellia sinensis]